MCFQYKKKNSMVYINKNNLVNKNRSKRGIKRSGFVKSDFKSEKWFNGIRSIDQYKTVFLILHFWPII